MTAGACPVRMRQSSSRNCTSRVRCRLFSTPQWPRTSASRASASAGRRCSSARSTAGGPEGRCAPPAPGSGCAGRAILRDGPPTRPSRGRPARCRGTARGGRCCARRSRSGPGPGVRRRLVRHRRRPPSRPSSGPVGASGAGRYPGTGWFRPGAPTARTRPGGRARRRPPRPCCRRRRPGPPATCPEARAGDGTPRGSRGSGRVARRSAKARRAARSSGWGHATMQAMGLPWGL